MALPSFIAKIAAGKVWAEDGDKIAPTDSSLDPALVIANGWPAAFSSTENPRRQVMNWIFNQLFGALRYATQRGGFEWSNQINYPKNARVLKGNFRWRAKVATGPGSSNATDPEAANQNVWEKDGATVDSPGTPNAPTATPGNGQLIWEWNIPLDGGAALSKFVFQWRVQGGQFAAARTINITPARNRYVLTGLSNGQTIEARVAAENSVGTGDYSTVGSGAPAAVAPGQVTSVVVVSA